MSKLNPGAILGRNVRSTILDVETKQNDPIYTNNTTPTSVRV